MASTSPGRRKGLGERLKGVAAAVGAVIDTAVEVVSSAGELLTDGELRRKGAAYVVQEASSRIDEVQRGAESIQQGARSRIGAGARQLQSVLRNIERQISEFQRAQTQRDLAAELEHHTKLPVDIQIGDQVFEEMPQEMRSRLWVVLLESPQLGAQLMRSSRRQQQQQEEQQQLQEQGQGQQQHEHQQQLAEREPGSLLHVAASSENAEAGLAASSGPGTGDLDGPTGRSESSPFAALAGSPGRAMPAPAGSGNRTSDCAAAEQAAGECCGSSPACVPAVSEQPPCASQPPSVANPWAAAPGTPAAACQAAGAGSNLSSSPSRGSGQSSVANPWGQAQPAGGAPAAAEAAQPAVAGAQPPRGAAAALPPVPSGSVSGAEGSEGWELVGRVQPSALAGGQGELEALDSLRTLVRSLQEEDSLDLARAAQQAVFSAMLEVPWVPGEGLPTGYAPDCEYARLLEAGCGVWEEVILRDVSRTFPEHPRFSSPEGQQRLLRLLMAYAAADTEIGYTQGMAFAAGVLLMYVPEEPAFRLFCRLMRRDGCNLRRLYLPGLDPLKLELSRFELLLSSHSPQLHQHLLDAGLPALLYAAQWFMTTFSCPFPVHVAARVLDILLQSNSDAILPRLGLAVMDQLQDELLAMDDFEQLITHLKVTPLSWPLATHRTVLAAALDSPASDTQLAAAAAATRDEAERLGRLPSFSARHLASQDTAGGGARHELAPGPMGPRTQAAAEAAGEAAEAAARRAGAGAAAASSSSSTPAAAAAAGEASAGAGEGGSALGGCARLAELPPVPPPPPLPAAASAGTGCADEDGVELLLELDRAFVDLLLPGGASGDGDDAPPPPPAAAALAPGACSS